MKEKNIITKDKLIRCVAKKTKYTIADYKEMYNMLEDTIFDILSSTSKEQDVCIKLFEGISLEGNYVPEKMKKNNLTGKESLVESRIKPKFNITRSYCEKLNNK